MCMTSNILTIAHPKKNAVYSTQWLWRCAVAHDVAGFISPLHSHGGAIRPESDRALGELNSSALL